MKVIQFDKQNKTKIWLINVKNDMKKNYKQMFNSNNKMYNHLWEQYVEIENRLITEGFQPIGIPDEMDFPLFEEYFISQLTENYTQWYKKSFNDFCEQMLETINKIEKYIEIM